MCVRHVQLRKHTQQRLCESTVARCDGGCGHVPVGVVMCQCNTVCDFTFLCA